MGASLLALAKSIYYIKLIFGIGLWKGGLPRPSHGLPRYSTTSECGPLPLGEEIFN